MTAHLDCIIGGAVGSFIASAIAYIAGIRQGVRQTLARWEKYKWN